MKSIPEIVEIGEQIKKRREQLGLTQGELAERCGYSSGPSAISHLEHGRKDPTIDKLRDIARALHCSPVYLLSGEEEPEEPVKIPVLGRVPAGVPAYAVEEILDYEEITPELARRGQFFALRVSGDSMEPRITDGDVVIVRQQEDCDSGNLAIVVVNGEDATLKKVIKNEHGITLVPANPKYDPITYSKTEIRTLPVRILGVVVELRAKFLEV